MTEEDALQPTASQEADEAFAYMGLEEEAVEWQCKAIESGGEQCLRRVQGGVVRCCKHVCVLQAE